MIGRSRPGIESWILSIIFDGTSEGVAGPEMVYLGIACKAEQLLSDSLQTKSLLMDLSELRHF